MPGGDLFTYLCKDHGPSPLPESECLMIMYQVLLGLNYLHQQGVVHRDLKLENILLEFPAPCSRVVLADFGAAWVHGQNPTSGRVGTPGYTAPELGLSDLSSSDDSETDNEILIETAPNAACDMYSLGVVLHRILSGTAPLFESIGGQRRINWQNAGWRTVSKTARQTVAKLLCENPLNRITCEGCSRLPWIGHRQQLLAYIYQTVVLRNQGPLGDVGYGNKGLTRGPTKRGGEGGAKKVRKGFKRDPKGV